jgi:hypothetical protein
MPWMILVRDMVWMVLLTGPFARMGLERNDLVVECDNHGIWIEAHGLELAAVWRPGWWTPPETETVEGLASELMEALNQKLGGVWPRESRLGAEDRPQLQTAG